MTDMGCNEASLDARRAPGGSVIAEGEVHERWTRGVSCLVGFRHGIVGGGEAGDLVKVMSGLQET